MRSPVNNGVHSPASDESESDADPTASRGHTSGGQRSTLPATAVQTPGQRDILDHTPLFRPARRMDKGKILSGPRNMARGVEGNMRWTLGGSGESNAEAGPSRLGAARLPDPIPHIRTVGRPHRRSLPLKHTDQPVSRPEKRRRTMMALTNTAGLNNAEAIVVSDDDDEIIFIPDPPASTTPRQPRASRDPARIPDTGSASRTVHVERDPDRQIRPDSLVPPITPASVIVPADLPTVTVVARTRTPSANDASQASAVIPSASPIVTSAAGPSRTPSTSHRPVNHPVASTSCASAKRPRKLYRVIPTDEAVIDSIASRRSQVDLTAPTPSPSPSPPPAQDRGDIIVIDDSEGEAEDEDQRVMDRHISRLEERTRLAAQKKAQEDEARQVERDRNDNSAPSRSAIVAAGQANTATSVTGGARLEGQIHPEQTMSDFSGVTASSSTHIVTNAKPTDNERDESAREKADPRQSEPHAEQIPQPQRRMSNHGCLARSIASGGVLASDEVLPVPRQESLADGQRKDRPEIGPGAESAGQQNRNKPGSAAVAGRAERPMSTQSEPMLPEVESGVGTGMQAEMEVGKAQKLGSTARAPQAAEHIAEGVQKQTELERRQKETQRRRGRENSTSKRLVAELGARPNAEQDRQRRDELQSQRPVIAQAAEARAREEEAEDRRRLAQAQRERQAEEKRLEAAASARRKKEEEEQAAMTKRKEEEGRLEAERMEKERAVQEKRRAAKEREDVERRERERSESGRLERERVEREQQEKEMMERLRQERLEKEQLDRLAREQAKKEEEKKREEERQERERFEAERVVLAKQREERERQEAKRLEWERSEEARIDKERASREQQIQQQQQQGDEPVRNDGTESDGNVVSAERDNSAETPVPTLAPLTFRHEHRNAPEHADCPSLANNVSTEPEATKQQRLAERHRIIRIAEAKRKKIMLEHNHQEVTRVTKSDRTQKAVLDLVARARAQAKGKIAEVAKGAEWDGKAREPTRSRIGRELPDSVANADRASKRKLLEEGHALETAGPGVSPGPEKRTRIAPKSSASRLTNVISPSANNTSNGNPTGTARVEVGSPTAGIPSQLLESSPTVPIRAAGTQSPRSVTTLREGHHATPAVPLSEAISSSAGPYTADPSTKIASNGISPTRPAPLFAKLFPGSDPAQDPMKRLDRMARFLDTLGDTKTKRSEAESVAVEVAAPMQAPPTPPEMQDHQPEPVHKAAETRPGPSVTQDVHSTGKPIEQSDLMRKYGLPYPISKGRINNKYTRFSTAIVPGTLKDLMWELDLLYYGSVRGRQDMRWQEEDKIWDNLRNLSDKRRFLQCCWNRWTTEKGPIRADKPAQHLRGWMDKYGEIMRFGGLDLEIRDHLTILLETNIIGLQTFSNVCGYWERHMRHYRKVRECPEPTDKELSDTEEYVGRGAIRLKEFEPGGRHHEEVIERRRAREEGRQPVLPKEKYVLE